MTEEWGSKTWCTALRVCANRIETLNVAIFIKRREQKPGTGWTIGIGWTSTVFRLLAEDGKNFPRCVFCIILLFESNKFRMWVSWANPSLPSSRPHKKSWLPAYFFRDHIRFLLFQFFNRGLYCGWGTKMIYTRAETLNNGKLQIMRYHRRTEGRMSKTLWTSPPAVRIVAVGDFWKGGGTQMPGNGSLPVLGAPQRTREEIRKSCLVFYSFHSQSVSVEYRLLWRRAGKKLYDRSVFR